MGDEPVADPDAMWKPGLFRARRRRPGRDDPYGRRRPGTGSPITAGRSVPVADGAAPPAPDPAPVPSPVDARSRCRPTTRTRRRRDRTAAPAARRRTGDGGRRRRRRRLADQRRRDVAEGGHRLASIPDRMRSRRGSPSSTPVTSPASSGRGRRSSCSSWSRTISSAWPPDRATERWRVNAAPSHSIAQLEEVEGAAIVLVEESTGDRSIAAYDLDSGERLWREDGLDRSAFVGVPGEHLPAPGRRHRRRDRAARSSNRRGPERRSRRSSRASVGRTSPPSATTSSRSSTCRPSNASAVRSPSATSWRHPRSAIGWWVSDVTP